MKKIKGKNFYREAITEINKKNKNSCALKELYEISELFCRAFDTELYETLTDKEHALLYCIRAVLHMEKLEDREHAEKWIRAVERNSRKPKSVAS